MYLCIGWFGAGCWVCILTIFLLGISIRKFGCLILDSVYWFTVYFTRDCIEFYLVEKCVICVILGVLRDHDLAILCALHDPGIALPQSPAPCQPHFVSSWKAFQASERTYVHKADVIWSLLACLSVLSPKFKFPKGSTLSHISIICLNSFFKAPKALLWVHSFILICMLRASSMIR